MSSLRPTKLSGSKLSTVAKGGVTAPHATGLIRPLSQRNLNVDSKKVRPEVEAGAEKTKAPAQANTAPPARAGLAQRGTRGATANTTGSTGSNLTRITSNLSKKGSSTTLNRSNTISNRPGLAGRNAANNKAPTMSQKEICDKLLNLEKKMEENAQAAKEQKPKKQQLNQEKMDLTAKLENCRNELIRVKIRLESKTIELENLEKSYQALYTEHRSYRRDMKEADNKRLSNLLDQERDETKRLNAELAEAIREKEAAKARMRENETRLKYISNQMLELKGNIRVFARVRPVTEEDGLTYPVPQLQADSSSFHVAGRQLENPDDRERLTGGDARERNNQVLEIRAEGQ